MRGWRLGSLLVEAWSNLVSGWPRTLALALIVAGVAAGLTASELTTLRRIVLFERGFVSAGGNVVIATNERRIPADRCSLLVARPDVVAAGGVQVAGPSEVNVAPGTLFQTALMTSGVAAVWDPRQARTSEALSRGIAVGSAAASELGVAPGAYLGMGSGRPQRVGVVLDVAERNPQAARWILFPVAPIGMVDQCWVEFVSGVGETGVALLEHLFADTGRELVVRPWIKLDEFARSPIEELRTRPQSRAWLPVGTVLALLFWLALWSRRSELGLYRALGMKRVEMLVHIQAEAVLVVVIGGMLGVVWGISGVVASGGEFPGFDEVAVVLRTVVSGLAVVAALGPVPALLTGDRRGLLEQLKDR